jgi:hypothetical protein
MSDHSVWFAPVRDVYDRSCLVQKVIVQENDTHVTIYNGNDREVKGLTLFTKSKPDFRLQWDSVELTAHKGSADSWHFIFDLGPGEMLVLEKVRGEAGTGAAHYDAPSASTLIMLVRETRTDR